MTGPQKDSKSLQPNVAYPSAEVTEEPARSAPVGAGVAPLAAPGAPPANGPSMNSTRALALQRMVGNAAAARLLTARPAAAPVVQRDATDVASSSGGVAGAGIGDIVSGIGVGTAFSDRSEHAKRRDEAAKGTGTGAKGRVSAQDRAMGKATTEGVSGIADVGSGAAETTAKGFELASAIGTATVVAADTAGVVASAVALPLKIFNFIRQSRRAHLQRERMVRLQANNDALATLKKTDATAAAGLSTAGVKDATRAAKAEHDKAVAELASIEEGLEKLKTERSTAQTSVSALQKAVADSTEMLNKAKKEKPTEDFSDATAELKALEKQYEAKQAELKQYDDQVAEYEESHKEEQARLQATKEQHAEAAKTYGEQEEIEKRIGADPAKGGSGMLTDNGEADTKMPSLIEINDYALRKNSRGFTRRAIGAGAAGLGVAAGAIGVAAAAEKLTGGASAGDLGIAGGVIAGVAAVIGIGVGIWKAISFFRKAKKQGDKMDAAIEAKNKANPTGPQQEKLSTWERLGHGDRPVKVDVERRHYATALYLYATSGTQDQRARAGDILRALDPKAEMPWNEKDKTTNAYKMLEPAPTPDEETQQQKDYVEHLMGKMNSGG